MKEFCCFSLSGRLRLLQQYGVLIFEKVTPIKAMAVFRLGSFYVVAIRNYKEGRIESVEPVFQNELLLFYLASGVSRN